VLKTKNEILKWLKNRINTNSANQITNWHWNDDLLEFMDEFCEEDTKVKDGQRKFTYYCKMLVDDGFLLSPKRVGLGAGGINEFGTKTQTTWTKNSNYEKDNELIEGLSYSKNELKKWKKTGLNK